MSFVSHLCVWFGGEGSMMCFVFFFFRPIGFFRAFVRCRLGADLFYLQLLCCVVGPIWFSLKFAVLCGGADLVFS